MVGHLGPLPLLVQSLPYAAAGDVEWGPAMLTRFVEDGAQTFADTGEE